MAINKGKHVEIEIDGVRCKQVEANVDAQRADFLTKLLTFNGYEVKQKEEENGTFTLGVTDLLFHHTFTLYERKLKTPQGDIVTPAYWLQKADKGLAYGEPDYYWELNKKQK